MKDPKNRPLLYIVTGVVAIAAALYFMMLSSSIFDWLILGMGIVSIVKGVQEYWQNGGLVGRRKKNGASGPGAPHDKA